LKSGAKINNFLPQIDSQRVFSSLSYQKKNTINLKLLDKKENVAPSMKSSELQWK